ncbi:transcription factor UNE10-like [Vicia villosa]|uniref:transcription factor UNE10-like n=1 Tax=Vicia villosa TaxID=3911 RepID=UPI00273CE8F6|nr:transcription factor UNE10-like [Vicia villosa]
MSQCVPSWEVDENPQSHARSASLRSNSNSTAPHDVPMLDYDVAELTWENGQISMHGLGLPRVPVKPVATTPSKETWEKPRGSGTLESIVNQATSFPHHGKAPFLTAGGGVYGNMLVPWLDPQRAAAIAAATAATNGMIVDALVPCPNLKKEQRLHARDPIPMRGIGSCMVGGPTPVGSCSVVGATAQEEGGIFASAKRGRVTAHMAGSGRDQSMNNNATFGSQSQQVTLDTYDREFGVTAGFTSTSIASMDNTSSDKQCTRTTTVDDHDSVCHSRPTRNDAEEDDKKRENRKSSVSTKRSRAAAIHNQSERKRRDKINQRMKTLQKLVPNSSKTDKASMLDEVIEYLKQLQAQVNMVNRFSMSSMMMPMTMQQQLQMSMMNPMGMGMGPMGMAGMGMGMAGMGMGMDMNPMNRANIPGMPPVLHPSAFMPMPAWDAAAATATDRLQGPPTAGMADPMSTFFGCQSQPMTMEAYSRIAAMYQQMQQQPPAPGSKT